MSFSEKINQYWYGEPSLGFKILDPLLIPFEILYKLESGRRNRIFNKTKNVNSLPCPVISIGNLTAGGSGKTPVTAFLLKTLNQNGLKVAICSRGYKGNGPHPRIVSSEDPYSEVGDEPLMLSRFCSPENGIIVVDPDRTRGGQYAIQNFSPDVILLDDGFQHRKLKRDSNWVLVDSKRFFGNGKTLPRGPLRESLHSLRRASLILLTNCTSKNLEESKKVIQKTCAQRGIDRPIAGGYLKPTSIQSVENETESLDLMGLKGQLIGALAGIANPQNFLDTSKSLGMNIRETFFFPDHHPFTFQEIESVIQKASEKNCTGIITSAKDAVRLKPILKSLTKPFPFWVINVEFQILFGEEIIKKEIEKIFSPAK